MNSMCCRNIKSVPKRLLGWMIETLGFAQCRENLGFFQYYTYRLAVHELLLGDSSVHGGIELFHVACS